jgi:hypothetical protein
VLFIFSCKVDRAVIQVLPLVLGAGPMDRFPVVSAEKIWGNLAVAKVLKTWVVVFSVVKSDV